MFQASAAGILWDCDQGRFNILNSEEMNINLGSVCLDQLAPCDDRDSPHIGQLGLN